jgi:phosphoglycolate phosphatase
MKEALKLQNLKDFSERRIPIYDYVYFLLILLCRLQNIQAPVNLKLLSLEEKKKFQDSFDTIISDCDGVLYNPNGVIRNAHEAVDKLAKQGKTVYYVTNTTRSQAEMVKHLTGLGFVNVTEDSIVSAGSQLVKYLQERLTPDKAVYVIGRHALCEELLKHGIQCFGPGKDEMDERMIENIAATEIEIRGDVGAVVIGMDVHFNYLKLLKAFAYLKNEECLFIAMSLDDTFLTGRGTTMPSTGAIVGAIRVASGREPFNIGKPGTHLIEKLKTIVGDPRRTLFVGDKLNSDILMGNRCSFRTVLTLTGIHGLNDVEKYAKSKDADERMCVPDYYIDAFSDLVFE